MTLFKFLRGLGWTYLLAIPIILGAWGTVETATSQCRVEAVVAPAPFMCSFLDLADERYATRSGSVSVVELASLRVGAISVYATILLGLIALVAGYKAFVRGRHAFGDSLSLDCQVSISGSDQEVAATLVNPSMGSIVVRTLEAASGATIFQQWPVMEIGGRSSREWTLIAGRSPLPPSIILRGAVRRSDGSDWNFEAEFEELGGRYRAKRLDQTRV